MITIPIEGFTPQECEELKTICLSLFVGVEDKRLMSVMHDQEVEMYVGILRESPVCEELYEMINIFGENHFVDFIKPILVVLASTHYDQESFLGLVENKIKEL